MKRGKLGKEKYKIYSLREKEDQKINGLLSSWDKGHRKFKEKPDAKLDKGGSTIRVNHPVKLPMSEKELKKN